MHTVLGSPPCGLTAILFAVISYTAHMHLCKPERFHGMPLKPEADTWVQATRGCDAPECPPHGTAAEPWLRSTTVQQGCIDLRLPRSDAAGCSTACTSSVCPAGTHMYLGCDTSPHPGCCALWVLSMVKRKCSREGLREERQREGKTAVLAAVTYMGACCRTDSPDSLPAAGRQVQGVTAGANNAENKLI